MEIIGDILVTVTVLLLAIMNVYNNKRISNLEDWLNVLIRGYKRK